MKLTRRYMCTAGLVGLTSVAAGCGGLSGLTSPPGKQAVGRPAALTEQVAPSLLITVAGQPGLQTSLPRLVAATAVPREDFELVWPGPRPQTLIASDSPRPAKVIAPGKPAAPGSGQTSYQQAGYTRLLKNWRGEVAAARLAVTTRTRRSVSAWERALHLPERLVQVSGTAGTLATECAAGTSVVASLAQASAGFGRRRLLLLYTSNLTGSIPAGELTGDEVIVVSAALPSAAAASAAQANLLAAGATQAVVVGPETTGAQLAQLVAADLGRPALRDLVSAPLLFANGSSVLLPPTLRTLARLVPLMMRPGTTAVIDGFASTPGLAGANYLLSYARAAAVAGYLEAQRMPAAALVIIGHGATDLTGPGASSANRRVLVVIEEPSS
jgi:outer membrane protein OmpA-like peptidoglycan-associated protein